MNVDCPYCKRRTFITGLEEGDDNECWCNRCDEWFRVEVSVYALPVTERHPEAARAVAALKWLS